MIPRYTAPELAAIWTDAHRFETWLRVEIASAAAWERRGVVPAGTAARLTERAKSVDFNALGDLFQHPAVLVAKTDVLEDNIALHRLGVAARILIHIRLGVDDMQHPFGTGDAQLNQRERENGHENREAQHA